MKGLGYSLAMFNKVKEFFKKITKEFQILLILLSVNPNLKDSKKLIHEPEIEEVPNSCRSYKFRSLYGIYKRREQEC